MLLKKVDFPLHTDDRGDLGVVEFCDYFDWVPQRFYYVTNVLKPRGGHCVKGEKKVYVVMKGSVVAKFFDGEKWFEFSLSGPNQGIAMEGDYWREFVDFSDDCVLAAISSLKYDPKLYILDFAEYQNFIKSTNQL